MKFRLTILACLVLSLLFSACGSSATNTTAENATPSAAVATAPAAPTAQPTAATAASAAPTAQPTAATAAPAAPTAQPTAETAAQATSMPEATPDIGPAPAACAEGQRRFEHQLLVTVPVCIPNTPKRVISLDVASLEMLLMLGQKPVATAQWILDEMPLLLPQYADELKGMPGLDYPANLEKVAALHPDVILAPPDTIDVALASKIAPVVTPDPIVDSDWKSGAEFWSKVLNVPDLYTKMEANYKTRIGELHAALGQSRPTISVVSASTYGISLWMPDSAPGVVLADIGLPRPASQSLIGDAAMAKYGTKQYVDISLERLDLADADTIFYFTYAAVDPKVAADEGAYMKGFEQQPVWQSLQAVKAKKAFFVPGYWWRCQTYLLANLVIDDLFTHLTNTKATTPVITGP